MKLSALVFFVVFTLLSVSLLGEARCDNYRVYKFKIDTAENMLLLEEIENNPDRVGKYTNP